ERDLTLEGRTATTVVMVSEGYPGDYQKGKTIQGLERVQHGMVFHAGTKVSKEKIVTNGGRVLALTGLGTRLEEALAVSYENASLIEYNGKTFRSDIGQDLLRLQQV
ncbi:MAG: phosphoribosylamine--glycine ligase, partial [Flavobacteriales bacterium]|nr:phosphoribosylamine--glycine ligase [Flavobacteriales bacterium]